MAYSREGILPSEALREKKKKKKNKSVFGNTSDCLAKAGTHMTGMQHKHLFNERS